MFSKPTATKKNEFLEQTKALRGARALERQKEQAIVTIQALTRRYLVRCRLCNGTRRRIDAVLAVPPDNELEYKPTLIPALELFLIIKKFLFVFDEKGDKKRYEFLCRFLLAGMSSDNIKMSYVSLSLNKQHVLGWISQLKEVLWKCCVYLKHLKPGTHSEMKCITVYIHMLFTFTSCAGWKILSGKNGEALKPGMSQLCNNVMGDLNSRGLYTVLKILLTNGLARSKPVFKHASLSALVNIALRPLIAANYSENLLSVFLLSIFSVPAVIGHIADVAPECMTVLITNRIFARCLDLLVNEQSTRIIFNSLEGNYSLCLLANLIQLGEIEIEGLVDNSLSFMAVVIRLLESCNNYVLNKKSNLTHWHPVLGWFSQKTDPNLHEAMPFVSRQLQLLWSKKMICLVFSELLSYIEATVYISSQKGTHSSPAKNKIKKAFEKAVPKATPVKIRLDSPIARATCLPCAMYQTALRTLTGHRMDILAGLSYQDILLPNLWSFIQDLGPSCGLKFFLDILGEAPNSTIHPCFSLLALFCEASAHLINILDEVEFYDQQKPFSLPSYTMMGEFLNQFIFKVIWNGLIDVRLAVQTEVFTSVHNLLMVLYERDCRRSYTPKNHWLLKDIKVKEFMCDLEKGRKTATFLMQKVPHIIPFKDRVILFRKAVLKEKETLGLTESAVTSPQSIPITIHRSRIIEDGYRQLSLLPPNAMKGIIRVKFVNEQGLDEAGIDQDGVFKEFLEEMISKVFDPSLNLFKVTTDQKLYPSPTSHIQENHLGLFEFVGKMLGKAVYENTVVDVPFASFFLTQLLGHKHNANYSFLDELPSLDAELYKNLTYMKHYDGDVSDLDLTFSCDEDFVGKLVTHELVPGGKAIQVTNDNKISYIHRMAYFRMYGQIKEQAAAFIHGFKSIVQADWLLMLSAPELQKLVSGDNVAMDIDDLRRHTQYYGGYHNSHKVVTWLWHIIEHDFNVEERSLFLKFVTSCSKPPLLGFAHMEPPFSIRCVEVSDDQDTGDTVGSVLKGFFNIRKKDNIGRLPTSSTCFNLLKLPNYQKKSTLREKLRYAIHSNTGFELS